VIALLKGRIWHLSYSISKKKAWIRAIGVHWKCWRRDHFLSTKYQASGIKLKISSLMPRTLPKGWAKNMRRSLKFFPLLIGSCSWKRLLEKIARTIRSTPSGRSQISWTCWTRLSNPTNTHKVYLFWEHKTRRILEKLTRMCRVYYLAWISKTSNYSRRSLRFSRKPEENSKLVLITHIFSRIVRRVIPPEKSILLIRRSISLILSGYKTMATQPNSRHIWSLLRANNHVRDQLYLNIHKKACNQSLR